ncbi:MAG: electron transfer flavoprotein subunit alpha/FixB family protein [Gammaproteobacteria bacterium]
MILIVVEHDGKAPRENFRNALCAARQIAEKSGGAEIEALVLGAREIADDAAKAPGLSAVRWADNAVFAGNIAENCAPVIAAESATASHVIMTAGALSRMWLPRAAALADSQMLSEVIAVESADTFTRPIYAGNALATVQSADKIKFLSVRATAFDGVQGAADSPCEVRALQCGEDAGLSQFTGEKVSKQERPELTSARIVVSGGRGVGGAENFRLLEELADALGAGVGASRAAVDEGYVPNDYQVGQTGKIVAPDLYLAVGISGAIQHLAGIRDSKCIAAINKDPDAPIFDIADYGLVGDLFEIVPALKKALES